MANKQVEISMVMGCYEYNIKNQYPNEIVVEIQNIKKLAIKRLEH